MRKSNIYYTTIKILIVYFPRFHFYSSAIVSHKENVQLSIFLCKTTFLDLTLWSQASNMLQIYFDVLLTINISSSRCIRNRLIIYGKWSYQSTTLKCIGPERLKISSLASITPYILRSSFTESIWNGSAIEEKKCSVLLVKFLFNSCCACVDMGL